MKNILIILGVIVVAVLIYLGVKSMYGPSENTALPTTESFDVGFTEPSTIPTSSSGLPLGSPTDLIPPSPTALPSSITEDSQQVSISALKFSPAVLNVKQGSTVVFTNNDPVAHTVTSATFDSGSIQPGGVFSQVFESKGTFVYKCTIHPTMTGTIIVQ